MARGSARWCITHYGKPCETQRDNWVNLEWYPGVVTRVLHGTEPIWLALGAIMLAYNYKVPTSYTGSYKCRNITGGTSISRHSWPLAIDINAATNGYRRTPSLRKIRWGVDTDMPAAMIRELEKITAAGIRAFTWGGRWRTVKDAMHFQARVSKNEISSGVVAPRGFYDGGGSLPIGDEMSLENGDKGSAVGRYQEGLIAWNADALPEFGADKDFGDETEEWVKLYQRAADLDQTGVIDGVTSALILSYLAGGGGEEETEPHKHIATVTEGTKVTIGENV